MYRCSDEQLFFIGAVYEKMLWANVLMCFKKDNVPSKNKNSRRNDDIINTCTLFSLITWRMLFVTGHTISISSLMNAAPFFYFYHILIKNGFTSFYVYVFYVCVYLYT